MTEKEQKGLKHISLSLVFGTLLDKKEHLWTKREQLFCSELLKRKKTESRRNIIERKSDKKCSYLLIAGWSAFPFL